MSRRLLVVGGTGLVGRALIPALRAAGWEPRLTRRGASLPAELADTELESVLWPGGDEVLPAAALEGCSALINLAGASIADGRWSKRRKQLLCDSRIATTSQLSAALALAPQVETFISASGSAIYGLNTARPVDEDGPSASDHFLATLAQDWEGATAAHSHQARTVHLRLGMVLAPDGGALAKIVPSFLPRIVPLVPLAAGTQGVPWIHRDDVVGMILRALDDQQWSGPVNVVAPETVDQRSFTRAAAHASGHPYLGLGVPRWVLRLALGEQADLVLADAWIQPTRAQHWSYPYQYPTLAPALAACFPSP